MWELSVIGSTSVFKTGGTDSNSVAPTYLIGELAERLIATDSKSVGVCTHPRQFESDTPRPIFILTHRNYLYKRCIYLVA